MLMLCEWKNENCRGRLFWCILIPHFLFISRNSCIFFQGNAFVWISRSTIVVSQSIRWGLSIRTTTMSGIWEPCSASSAKIIYYSTLYRILLSIAFHIKKRKGVSTSINFNVKIQYHATTNVCSSAWRRSEVSDRNRNRFEDKSKYAELAVWEKEQKR